MNDADSDRKRKIKNLRMEYIDLPEMPNVRKIYDLKNGVMFVNTAAKPKANIISFHPEHPPDAIPLAAHPLAQLFYAWKQ